MKLRLNYTVLGGFLFLSLLANAWLVAALRGSAPRDATARNHAPSAVNAPSATQSTGSAPPAPLHWPARATSDAELKSLAGKLRAAGFPPRVVAAMVSQAIRDRELANVAALPFWQLANPGKDARSLQAEAHRAVLAHQIAVLGDDGRASRLLDPAQRAERYGALGDDKVDALLALERDYYELHKEIPAFTLDPAESKTLEAQRVALQDAWQADLAAALTAEEMSAYKMRSSDSADRLMQHLRNIDLSEEEYAAVFKFHEAYDAAQPSENFAFLNVGSAEHLKLLASRHAFYDQLSTVLSEERRHEYLLASDTDYRAVAEFAQTRPAVTPALAYETYKVHSELAALYKIPVSDMSVMDSWNGEQRRQFRETRTAKVAVLSAKLDRLLTPEIADAYRKQPDWAFFFRYLPAAPPAQNTRPGGD